MAGGSLDLDSARAIVRAAAAIGISVARVKMMAFAMSAFVAGIAGCLLAYRFGAVSDSSYGLNRFW